MDAKGKNAVALCLGLLEGIAERNTSEYADKVKLGVSEIRNNLLNTEEDLDKEIERYYQENRCYTGKYNAVIPVYKHELVDMARHFVNWYKERLANRADDHDKCAIKGLWHSIDEESEDKTECLIISRRGSKDVLTYSRSFFYKGHVVAEPCKVYAMADITKWVYIKDLVIK